MPPKTFKDKKVFFGGHPAATPATPLPDEPEKKRNSRSAYFVDLVLRISPFLRIFDRLRSRGPPYLQSLAEFVPAPDPQFPILFGFETETPAGNSGGVGNVCEDVGEVDKR